MATRYAQTLTEIKTQKKHNNIMVVGK